MISKYLTSILISCLFLSACKQDPANIHSHSNGKQGNNIGINEMGGADTGGGNATKSTDEQIIEAIEKVKSYQLPLSFQRIELHLSSPNPSKSYFIIPKKINRILLEMLHGNSHNPKNIFEDISQRKYELLRDKSCYDHNGKPHDAGFNKDGSICFSIKRLKRIPPQDLLFHLNALAAHEHVHAYNFWNEAKLVEDLFLNQNQFESAPKFAQLPNTVIDFHDENLEKIKMIKNDFFYEFIKKTSYDEYLKSGSPNLLTIKSSNKLHTFGQINQAFIDIKSNSLFVSSGVGYAEPINGYYHGGYYCRIPEKNAQDFGTSIKEIETKLNSQKGYVLICNAHEFEGSTTEIVIREINDNDFSNFLVLFGKFHTATQTLDVNKDDLSRSNFQYRVISEGNQVCSVVGGYYGFIQSTFTPVTARKYQLHDEFLIKFDELIGLLSSILIGYCDTKFKDSDQVIAPIEPNSDQLLSTWVKVLEIEKLMLDEFDRYIYLSEDYNQNLALKNISVF